MRTKKSRILILLLAFVVHFSFAQDKTITGTVTDGDGLPLPGVNIIIEGTSIGTQTDFDGNYSITASEGQVLLFTYIGQKEKRITVSNSNTISVQMQEDAEALEEVIVTAQGIKREKQALGYAVSEVGSEELEQRAEGDVGRVLSGKASGLNITQQSGLSGSGTNIVIRGFSSFSGSNQPLFIVDGVPFASETNSSGSIDGDGGDDFIDGNSGSSRFLDLDPNNIESVNVLKGLAAATLYGTQGRNGVILITTKKSTTQDDVTHTKFVIKKPYTIVSDGDITVMEINTFKLDAKYEYFAAPLINENVFLTSKFKDWEQYNLLPGEASIYFKGTYAGKTTIDPYTTKKEMTLSLGVDSNISVTRKQNKNFKSKSFTGSNRILNRTYDLEVKNNKNKAVNIVLTDRIPISQNKDIKVDELEVNSANYDSKKGLLTWNLKLSPQESKTESFSFQVKYPKSKRISL